MIYGYIRVSTGKQAEHGESLPAQEELIRQYCEREGLAAPDIRVEAGASAKSITGRPVFSALLKDLKKNDVLVVVKMDRAFRSLLDGVWTLKLFDAKGIKFHSITEKFDTSTAMGRAFVGMLLVMGQLGRELIAENTEMGLAEVRRQGRKTGGGVPYGWDVVKGGKLVENPHEQGVIARIRGLRRNGIPFHHIAGTLNAEGYQTKKGKYWSATQVQRAVANAERFGKNEGNK